MGGAAPGTRGPAELRNSPLSGICWKLAGGVRRWGKDVRRRVYYIVYYITYVYIFVLPLYFFLMANNGDSLPA